VKRTTPLFFLLLLALIAPCGCHRKKQPNNPAATQTIAPAVAQPDPSGTDAGTQTVEVEDSRSEAEGGVLTDTTSTAKATPQKKAKHPNKQ
jgi:hypothetical protein